MCSFMETMLNLNAQANVIKTARPNLIHYTLACICNGFWASHAPVQAHAWRPSFHMHTSLARLASFHAINTDAWLHSFPTLRRLTLCRIEILTSIKRNFEFSSSIFQFNFQLPWLIIELQFLSLASFPSQDQVALKNWKRSCLVKLHFKGCCSNFFDSKLLGSCSLLVFVCSSEVVM